MNLDLLDGGILQKAIESTGKLSELVEVIRVASAKGFRLGRSRITEEELNEALESMRMAYDMTLTQAHKRELLAIYNSGEARDRDPDSVLIREMLFSLTAVEYRHQGERWCVVNPLLLPLVERWTQSP
jgi:hypothetical protein